MEAMAEALGVGVHYQGASSPLIRDPLRLQKGRRDGGSYCAKMGFPTEAMPSASSAD